MQEYLKRLDEYIDLKIQYSKKEMTPLEKIELSNTKAEMEVALLLLIKKTST